MVFLRAKNACSANNGVDRSIRCTRRLGRQRCKAMPVYSIRTTAGKEIHAVYGSMPQQEQKLWFLLSDFAAVFLKVTTANALRKLSTAHTPGATPSPPRRSQPRG